MSNALAWFHLCYFFLSVHLYLFVHKGYGLTETSPLTHATPFGSTKLAAIGVPVPNQVAKVVIFWY